MSKRSAEEKLAHYQRKIRKIEEAVKKKGRIRRPRRLDSSDEDIIQETSRAELIYDEPYSEQPQESQIDELQTPPTPPPPPPSPPRQPAPDAAPPEPVLDPLLLSALGACSSDTPDFGERIHESLANLWLPLLRKGLTKDDKDNLTKEYLIPENCKLLQAPKLNAEISAAVSEVVRGRDKKLTVFQQELGAGISAINRAMDTMLKTDNKAQALKNLSDGCRLLSNVHYCLTKDRTKLIIPSLEKKFLHVIQDTERDDTLFGNSLADKIKACKAIERQGLQIRKTNNMKSITPQTSTSRPAQQGNWTGPPRYPSNRGGRGGQRRPPVASATRRPYPTTTAPIQPFRNAAQPKSRANTHH